MLLLNVEANHRIIEYAYMVSVSNITLARVFRVVSISSIIYLLYRLLPLSIYMTINTVHCRRRCNDRYPLLHQSRLRSFPFRWKSKEKKKLNETKTENECCHLCRMPCSLNTTETCAEYIFCFHFHAVCWLFTFEEKNKREKNRKKKVSFSVVSESYVF